MSEVLQLKCPKCGHPARVNAALVGHQWQCQGCGARFEVSPAVQATATQSAHITVVCNCGKRFRARRELEGREAKCPACSALLVIRDASSRAREFAGTAAAVPATPDSELERGPSRGALLGGIAAAALLLISAGAFWLGRMSQTEDPAPAPAAVTRRTTPGAERTTPVPARVEVKDAAAAPGESADDFPASAPATDTPGEQPAPAVSVTSAPAAQPARAGVSASPPQVPRVTAEERLISAHTAPITCLAFSPDGRYVASSSSHPDACVLLWDAPTGKQIHRLTTPQTRAVNAFAFSRDSRLLLSSDGPRLRLWEVESGREIALMTGHRSDVLAVTFSHSGAFAVSGGWDQRIRLWDVQKGVQVREFSGHSGKVRALDFAADDLTFVSAGDDGMIRRWETGSGRSVTQWAGRTRSISSVQISPDGSFVATSGVPLVSGNPPQTSPPENPLAIWTADGREAKRLPASSKGVWRLQFSADGKYLLTAAYTESTSAPSGNAGPQVSLWNVAMAREVLHFGDSSIRRQEVCFSPDGRLVAGGGMDGAIRIWRVPDEFAIDVPIIAHAEQRSLPEISRSLSAGFGALLEAGKADEARALIEQAQRDLRLFASVTQIPLWDNPVAPLMRLAESKKVMLQNEAGRRDGGADPGEPPATQPAGKLPAEQTRQLVAIRGTLNNVSTLVRGNKLSAAQAEIYAAQERLKSFVDSTGVPEWHLAVASVFQLAATRQTELDTRRGVEESRVAALAEAAKRKAEAGGKTPAAPAPSTLAAGQVAPPFMAATVEGKQFSLQQFRGKYVLIDFWATWCGPCKAEMPHLKDVYATFGKDKRFAMMSLSIDNQVNDPLNYAKQNELGWIQGFLGQGWNSPVLKAYGVGGIPALFLIGPDGKIAATGMRGTRIKDAVAQALSR